MVYVERLIRFLIWASNVSIDRDVLCNIIMSKIVKKGRKINVCTTCEMDKYYKG